MPTPTFEPIADRIVDDVVAALANMSLASGFQADYIVTRERPDGISPRDGLICVVEGDPEPTPSPPLGLDEYDMAVAIVVFALKPDDRQTPITTWLRRYAADVRRKLGEDRHRGGLAVNTTFAQRDELDVDPVPMVLITPSILFRTLMDNPYQR